MKVLNDLARSNCLVGPGLIVGGINNIIRVHVAHLRQECHNSKFGIFELLVYKETFADTLLTGIVS